MIFSASPEVRWKIAEKDKLEKHPTLSLCIRDRCIVKPNGSPTKYQPPLPDLQPKPRVNPFYFQGFCSEIEERQW